MWFTRLTRMVIHPDFTRVMNECVWFTPQACFVPSNSKWTIVPCSLRLTRCLHSSILTHPLPPLTLPVPLHLSSPYLTLPCPHLSLVLPRCLPFPYPHPPSSLPYPHPPSSLPYPHLSLSYPTLTSPCLTIPRTHPLPYPQSSLARHLTPDMYRELCGKTRMAEGWSIESASRSGVECPPTPVGNKHCQHVLSMRFFNLAFQHILSTQPFNTSFQHILSTHPFNLVFAM